MVDNVAVTAGAGTTIATDDVGGVQYQRVKVTWGADGTANDANATTPLPVTATGGVAHDAADSGNPIKVGGRYVATSSAVTDGDRTDFLTDSHGNQRVALWGPNTSSQISSHSTALTGLAASSTGLSVVARNYISNGTSLDVALSGAGAVGAGVQRVTMANDAPSFVQDDAAFTPGTSYVQMVGFEFDDTGTDSVNEGDAGAARMSGNRNVYTQIRDAAGNERGLNVDASGRIDVTLGGVVPAYGAGVTGATVQRVDIASDSALISAIAGNVAHDDADTGNNSKIGAKAETSLKGITPVSDGDRTDLYADSDGVLIVKLNTPNADILTDAISNTDGASTASAVFTAVASTRNYITHISAFRTDTATTMSYVDVRDGTGGNVLFRVPLPPGGGSSFTSATPLFKTTANTALAYDVSSALSTIYINAVGYQSKV